MVVLDIVLILIGILLLMQASRRSDADRTVATEPVTLQKPRSERPRQEWEKIWTMKIIELSETERTRAAELQTALKEAERELEQAIQALSDLKKQRAIFLGDLSTTHSLASASISDDLKYLTGYVQAREEVRI